MSVVSSIVLKMTVVHMRQLINIHWLEKLKHSLVELFILGNNNQSRWKKWYMEVTQRSSWNVMIQVVIPQCVFLGILIIWKLNGELELEFWKILFNENTIFFFSLPNSIEYSALLTQRELERSEIKFYFAFVTHKSYFLWFSICSSLIHFPFTLTILIDGTCDCSIYPKMTYGLQS